MIEVRFPVFTNQSWIMYVYSLFTGKVFEHRKTHLLWTVCSQLHHLPSDTENTSHQNHICLFKSSQIIFFHSKSNFYEDWETLLFYSLETKPNGSSAFRLAAKLPPDKPGKLTEHGRTVLREAVLSGLFGNRFRGFHGATLRIGVIKVCSFY